MVDLASDCSSHRRDHKVWEGVADHVDQSLVWLSDCLEHTYLLSRGQ